MLKAWRRAAVAALAGAAAIAAQFAVIAPAQAAAPTITINATTKLTAVARATGDALVVYHAGPAASATIHGRITGVTKGEIATVYAQQFPFIKPAIKGASVTIKVNGKTTYSFPVTPTLATRYKVRVFASSTAKTALTVSAAQYVYVAPLGSPTPPTKSCGSVAPVTCHVGFSLFEFVPNSALAVEIHKHVYPYFGLSLSPTGTPPPPKSLVLNAGNPRVTVRRINAGEFKLTLAFTFNIGSDAAQWDFSECQRDSVSKDGLGLPGSHGCGASRISASSVYLG